VNTTNAVAYAILLIGGALCLQMIAQGWAYARFQRRQAIRARAAKVLETLWRDKRGIPDATAAEIELLLAGLSGKEELPDLPSIWRRL
jgi:hypothetical protein